jgi:hypothetical protein
MLRRYWLKACELYNFELDEACVYFQEIVSIFKEIFCAIMFMSLTTQN